MQARWIVLAAALAGSMLCPLRADALDAHAAISRCAVTAGANLQGLDALRRACPGIDQAIASLGVGRLLPADWDKKASAATLRDLDALAQRYAVRPSSALPAASELRAIALPLQQPPAPSAWSSLWDHIKDRLRHLAPLEALLKWLHALPSGSPGSGVRAVPLIGAGALILLGVAAMIYTGLRGEGPLGSGRRRRSDARRHSALTRVVTAEENAEDAVDAAHALDHPGSALRMLIAALRRSRRIERDGNLTCREVLARAVFDTQGQREGFAAIALLAERELFGPRGFPLAVPDELRPTLQTLYHQLLAAPAARSAAS
ncbi:MAG: hypothetical protein WB823_08580 [Steroidobacteraceae bacterium]